MDKQTAITTQSLHHIIQFTLATEYSEISVIKLKGRGQALYPLNRGWDYYLMNNNIMPCSPTDHSNNKTFTKINGRRKEK